MKLSLVRYSDNGKSTLGILFIDGKFACYTLEDTFRKEKVFGETRIPTGEFRVELRNTGGMNEKYSSRYGDLHRGMLWIKDVPNFEYIYIHKGNDIHDTSGCILVGDQANNNNLDEGFMGMSKQAYDRIYPVISGELIAGKSVTITVTSEVQINAR
jgi:hypothetical protein